MKHISDLTSIISSYLSPKDILQCMHVSKKEYDKWFPYITFYYLPSQSPLPLPLPSEIKYNKIPLNIIKSNWIVKYCTDVMLLDIIHNKLNVTEIIFSIEFTNFPDFNISEIFKNLNSLKFLKYPYKNSKDINRISNNFSKFNQNIDNIFLKNTFPKLEIVKFGRYFNNNIDILKNLSKLVSLKFGIFSLFNQNIDNTFREGYFTKLQSLTFGNKFNKNIDALKYIPNLQILNLGSDFNQNIDNTFLKGYFPKLQSLTFGFDFNKNIDNAFKKNCLENLKILVFGFSFNNNINSISNLINLEKVILRSNFDKSYVPLLKLQKLKNDCNYNYYIMSRMKKINPL
jgi:hypothetical protein